MLPVVVIYRDEDGHEDRLRDDERAMERLSLKRVIPVEIAECVEEAAASFLFSGGTTLPHIRFFPEKHF